MAKQVSILSVFVASPSDLDDERDCLEEVIRELNLQWTSRCVRLELVRWETHAYPAVGLDPQDVINKQIGEDYDIFVGLLWKKFGTATPRAGSGTEEEFNRAFARLSDGNKSPRILVYFKTAGADLSEIDPTELSRIRDFQRKLGPMGTLYWEFKSRDDLSPIARIHLARCVEDWEKNKENDAVATLPRSAPATCDPSNVEDEEGFFDLIEISNASFDALGKQLERISKSTETLNTRITERTAEIDAAKGAGEKIEMAVAKRIVNKAADDLEDYAKIMDAEVPIFAARFKEAVECYAKAAAMLPDLSSENEQVSAQLNSLIESVSGLRVVTDQAGGSVGGLRQSIASTPRLTTQYNRARRHAMAALEAFLAEIKTGSKRLIDCQMDLYVMRAELPPSTTKQEDRGTPDPNARPAGG